MKRFIAFLFAIVMLIISKPMLSFAQEQDTAKPAIPVSDTSGHAPVMMPDSGKTGSIPVTDTNIASAKSNKFSQDKSGEITDRIQNKEKIAPKKHWNLLYRIHMIGHKKRERRAYINQGHHEFYLRTKRDRKRISRHHLNPYKPAKSSKKMQREIQRSVNKRNKDKNARLKDSAPDAEQENKNPKEESVKQEPEAEKPKENKDAPKSDAEKPKADTTKPKLFFDIR